MLKIALVGRPNVGKSTLFNRLTGCWDALVAGEAGLTRDRRYGVVEEPGRRWLLVDTGGLIDPKSAAGGDIVVQMLEQTGKAIDEADLVCLVVDATEGLTALDELVATRLRRAGKCSWLVINKLVRDRYEAEAEFSPLGMQPYFCTAALRHYGIKALKLAMAEWSGACTEEDSSSEATPSKGLRVAFVGRPNVGKSTLLNCLVGESRLLTSAVPGTTRDSICVPFEFNGSRYILVDTAGVRRRRKVDGRVEALGAMQALESAVLSDVVVLVCDAGDGITAQDAALANRIISGGRALVVAINKRDLIVDREGRRRLARSFDLGLHFLSGIKVIELSALLGQGMDQLMHEVKLARASSLTRVPTPVCVRLLNEAVQHNHPPLSSGRRIKLRYAHQGGTCPPRFIAYGSRVDRLPASYRRYLEGFFRERLHLTGTPVVFEFRRTRNRFVEE